MRVALVLSSWTDPVLRGVLLDLAAEYARRGVSAFVIARREASGDPFLAMEGTLPVYRTGLPPFPPLLGWAGAALNLLAIPWQTLRILSRQPHDLVHYHFGGHDENLVALASPWLRKPLFVTFHAVLLLNAPSDPAGSLFAKDPRSFFRRRFHRRLCARLVEKAAAVSSVAESFRDVLAERFPRFRGKMACIHNGIDMDFFKDPRPRPSPTPRPYLLSIARIVPIKGLDLLAFAFRGLLDRGKDLDLVICGSEEDGGHLRGLVAALGLSRRVRFAGVQSKEQIARWLAGCEFFVLPARYGGSYSLAVLEAFAAGKTVVATAGGKGQRWRLTHERDSLLFPPLDARALEEAMTRLLEDAPLKARLEAGGAETAAPFHRRAMSERYLRWYQPPPAASPSRIESAMPWKTQRP